MNLTPEMRKRETIGIFVHPHSNTSGDRPVNSSFFFTGFIPGGSLRTTFLCFISVLFIFHVLFAGLPQYFRGILLCVLIYFALSAGKTLGAELRKISFLTIDLWVLRKTLFFFSFFLSFLFFFFSFSFFFFFFFFIFFFFCRSKEKRQ